MPHVGYFPERGCPKPLSIGAPAFVPASDAVDYAISNESVWSGGSLVAQSFYAPVKLPHRARINKVTLYGYKNVSGGYVQIRLLRFDREFTSGVMVTLTLTLATGYQSVEDDSIWEPEIDNENYDYGIHLEIDPDAVPGDNYFTGAKIDWN